VVEALAASPAAGSPPAWALRLGYAGLIPFGVGALFVWIVSAEAHPYVALGLAAYAATIVSFLGGIHWGVAFRESQPDPRIFGWGVIPTFGAWVGVMMPPSAGLVLLGAMLVLCYAVDRRLYPMHGLQRWLTLRFRLSAVAASCCFLAAAGT
jgi:Protein of unknown function (DUF3429)